MAKKQVIFRLEEDIYKKLQIYAVENETSVQKLIEDYVCELLKSGEYKNWRKPKNEQRND